MMSGQSDTWKVLGGAAFLFGLISLLAIAIGKIWGAEPIVYQVSLTVFVVCLALFILCYFATNPERGG